MGGKVGGQDLLTFYYVREVLVIKQVANFWFKKASNEASFWRGRSLDLVKLLKLANHVIN